METRPIVGVVVNTYTDLVPREKLLAIATVNIEPLVEVADAVPILLTPTCSHLNEILNICHGFFLPPAFANIHPSLYGESPTAAHGKFDEDRDEFAMLLIKAAIAQDIPLLGCCRGFQDMAVACGSTLHAEVHHVPGREDHRLYKTKEPPKTGGISDDAWLSNKHHVNLHHGGELRKLTKLDRIVTNSAHSQGIDQPGQGIVIEGSSEDGTPEALHIQGATFALAVQWHPERHFQSDIVSQMIYQAFGDAMRTYQKRARR